MDCIVLNNTRFFAKPVPFKALISGASATNSGDWAKISFSFSIPKEPDIETPEAIFIQAFLLFR